MTKLDGSLYDKSPQKNFLTTTSMILMKIKRKNICGYKLATYTNHIGVCG